MHPGKCSALPNFLISLINNSSPDISWDRIERASSDSSLSSVRCPVPLSLSHVRSIILPSSGHLPVQSVARDDVTRRQGEREGERAGRDDVDCAAAASAVNCS